MKKSFWVYLILTILIMSGIFFLSAQEGEKSTDMSMQITKKIITDNKYTENTEKSLSKRQWDFDVVTRKSAHIFIYTSLGFCVFMTLAKSGKFNKNMLLFITALLICIIYASSDEIHQLYVSERSGEVRDVFIDTAGSAVGIIIALLINKKRVRK